MFDAFENICVDFLTIRMGFL